MTSIDASMKAASDIYEKGVYKSRVIRKCSSYWLNHGTLPKSLQGCHQKTKSFIDDEDVIEQSSEQMAIKPHLVNTRNLLIRSYFQGLHLIKQYLIKQLAFGYIN